MQEIIEQADVFVGDSVVTVKRKGSSAVSCAQILGTEFVDGLQTIYLDRVIHGPGEQSLGEFSVKGAVSSILTRTQ